METLDLDGKRYIKISSAARETGYTSDYIGQLCRAKKIDAKLVGRTWYVHEEELHAHQRTRGRSSHEKARKAVKDHITTVNGSEITIPIHIIKGSAPEYRKRLLEQEIRYHRDDSELLPNATAVHLKATSSDDRDIAQTLTVNSEKKISIKDTDESSVKFNTAEKQEIKWNGTIVIEPLEDTSTSLGDGEYKKSASTAVSTLHLNVKDHERATTPHINVTHEVHDRLAIKERFLTRLNQAHDFNEVSKVKPEDTIQKLPLVQKQPTPVKPVMVQMPSVVTPLCVGVCCLALFFATTVFLQKVIEFTPGGGSTNSAGSFTSRYTLASLQHAKTTVIHTISTIRDTL